MSKPRDTLFLAVGLALAGAVSLAVVPGAAHAATSTLKPHHHSSHSTHASHHNSHVKTVSASKPKTN